MRLARNEATYRIVPAADAEHELDLECVRVLVFAEGHTKPVVERVEGLGGGVLEFGPGPERLRLPAWVRLLEGTTEYAIRRAARRTLERARREDGPGAAFEWVACRTGTVPSAWSSASRACPRAARPSAA